MNSFRLAPAWLADAVFYQIYPQSFADSNGDGIGDFDGIAQRLDHLEWLGVNTVWLNPCFDSPFGDAGYDVADYLNVAPRYGSNDDLAKLVDLAGRRGIRVLLDLVAGHTSAEHPWFRASANDPDDHRYIWAPEGRSGVTPDGFVASPGSRPARICRISSTSSPLSTSVTHARVRPSHGGSRWTRRVRAPTVRPCARSWSTG